MASDYASKLVVFLDSQGDPPQPHPGENNVDFVIRSNAWYERVMKEYKAGYADQAKSLAQLLIEEKVLDSRVMPLFQDPQNPLGIRAIATQLRGASLKLIKEKQQSAKGE